MLQSKINKQLVYMNELINQQINHSFGGSQCDFGSAKVNVIIHFTQTGSQIRTSTLIPNNHSSAFTSTRVRATAPHGLDAVRALGLALVLCGTATKPPHTHLWTFEWVCEWLTPAVIIQLAVVACAVWLRWLALSTPADQSHALWFIHFFLQLFILDFQ